MGYQDGLRINARVEKDIKPFLIRNHLWDAEKDEPSRSSIILGYFEYREDITERTAQKSHQYWHFTQKGKENICKLIMNVY